VGEGKEGFNSYLKVFMLVFLVFLDEIWILNIQNFEEKLS
jgi:hypothetical protein